MLGLLNRIQNNTDSEQIILWGVPQFVLFTEFCYEKNKRISDMQHAWRIKKC